MDPASFLPAARYNNSPQRLEYERERSPIDITKEQVSIYYLFLLLFYCLTFTFNNYVVLDHDKE